MPDCYTECCEVGLPVCDALSVFAALLQGIGVPDCAARKFEIWVLEHPGTLAAEYFPYAAKDGDYILLSAL